MNVPGWVRLVASGLVIAVAAGIGYWNLYHAPRREILQRLERQLEANRRYEEEIKDHARVTAALKAVAATTLGVKPDEVDSRFRGALSELLEKRAGLTGVNVDTQKPVVVANPAGANPRLNKPPDLRRALQRQRDFAVITGTIEGKGSLEQVLKAAAMIQAQPWVHRVDSFSIKPEGRDRERFTLKMGVATILMADLAPKDAAVEIRGIEGEAAANLAAIVGRNVFKAPTARAATPPADRSRPAAPPAPPTPPYAEWKLTGLVESRLGLEAFMVNVKNGQRLTLPVGAAVADARFVSGTGERAIFEIDGTRYEVVNGQTLEQRRPAEQ